MSLFDEISRFNLVTWWFAAFSKAEHYRMEELYRPMLKLRTDSFCVAPQTPLQFLERLAYVFRTLEDEHIAQKVLAHIPQFTDMTASGIYDGRHFTTYVNEIQNLIRKGQAEPAERLLLALLDVIDKEARVERHGVPPWYYERLTVIYRARRDYISEIAILERYCIQQEQRSSRGRPDMQARLEKARALLARQSRAC